MSASLKHSTFNPVGKLNSAIHQIAPQSMPGTLVATLFPDGGANVIETPAHKKVDITLRNQRGAHRAGADGPTEGLGRGGDRTSLRMYASDPVQSSVKRWGSSIEIFNEDFIDIANVDPESRPAALAAMLELELEAASDSQTAHTRYWEADCYRTIFGPSLNFVGAGFTSNIASGLDVTWNPGNNNMGSESFDWNVFIQYALRDLKLKSGGALNAAGVTIVVTPETVLAAGKNRTLLGINLMGTVGNGLAAVQGTTQLAQAECLRKIASLDPRITQVLVADSVYDKSDATAANMDLDHLMGTQIGISLMVNAPANARNRQGNWRALNTAMVRHSFKRGNPRWVENKNNTGRLFITDRWQGFTVLDANFGANYYDA